jgi:hypothetical protein
LLSTLPLLFFPDADHHEMATADIDIVSAKLANLLVRARATLAKRVTFDIIAVSCDSFDEATNVKIGRGTGSHLEKFKQLRILCQEQNDGKQNDASEDNAPYLSRHDRLRRLISNRWTQDVIFLELLA